MARHNKKITVLSILVTLVKFRWHLSRQLELELNHFLTENLRYVFIIQTFLRNDREKCEKEEISETLCVFTRKKTKKPKAYLAVTCAATRKVLVIVIS